MSVAPNLAPRAGAIDVESYQRFWESVPVSELEPFEGQMVAVGSTDQGWRIVAGAPTLEALLDALKHAGLDANNVVFDRVHLEEHTSAGVELT